MPKRFKTFLKIAALPFFILILIVCYFLSFYTGLLYDGHSVVLLVPIAILGFGGYFVIAVPACILFCDLLKIGRCTPASYDWGCGPGNFLTLALTIIFDLLVAFLISFMFYKIIKYFLKRRRERYLS